jgi:hypothetical protein
LLRVLRLTVSPDGDLLFYKPPRVSLPVTSVD